MIRTLFTTKKYLWIGAAAILLGFLGLGGFALHLSEADYPQKQVVRELRIPPTAPTEHAAYWHDEAVQTGDNLSLILMRLGINERSIQTFLKESPIDTKMLQLRAGQIISVRIDGDKNVSDVQFFNDDDNGERNLIAIQKINGKWQLNSGMVDSVTLPSLRSVVANSDTSLVLLARAGIPVEIRAALKEIFADKVSLDTLHKGDRVSLLYESLYFHGQEIATGNILAAEIEKNGQIYRAYYFEQGDNSGNYYDENGQALKQQGFSGQPIARYTRISSPYGIRVHPVLGSVRMHTGIDYAAPSGTPILAPADGIVSFAGWKGGYGNAIMLRHSNGMETLYAHMSAFISGVGVGKSVKAGDTIGLVGTTGRSTGPHLHYEVRINGQHVNPAAIALPIPKLSAHDLAAIKQYRQAAETTMLAVRGLPVMVAQRD